MVVRPGTTDPDFDVVALEILLVSMNSLDEPSEGCRDTKKNKENEPTSITCVLSFCTDKYSLSKVGDPTTNNKDLSPGVLFSCHETNERLGILKGMFRTGSSTVFT